MKAFETFQWKSERSKRELQRFRALLAARAALGERSDILPFFRKHGHLAALLGSYHPNLGTPDRLAFEFDLFGEYAADLVVGDSVKRAYNFIEFEDATPGSVFRRQAKRHSRVWSPKFEQGYSQIIDWFAVLHDAEKSVAYVDRFDAHAIDFIGTLVVGRSRDLSPSERRRLEWRRHRVIVDSRKIWCVTYDELLEDFARRLERYDQLTPAE